MQNIFLEEEENTHESLVVRGSEKIQIHLEERILFHLD